MKYQDIDPSNDRLHRELRGLPGLKAPSTLAPRVLAAIAARQHAPWWKKSWASWPSGLRIAFLVLGVGALSGLVVAGTAIPQLASALGDTLSGIGNLFAGLRPYFELLERMSRGVTSLFQAAGPQVMWYLAALVGVAYATCIGLGTLGYRLVLNRI